MPRARIPRSRKPRLPACLLAVLLAPAAPGAAPADGSIGRETSQEMTGVAGSLSHYGSSALALHGNMEQRDRDEVLVQFANHS